MAAPGSDYEPDEMDIEWAKTVLNLIADGGILAYPSTQLIYRVDHLHQTVTLLNRQRLEDEDSAILHRRSIRVFERIGWTVHVEEH